MSTQGNLQLIRSFFQAMDSNKLDQLSSFLAPNVEFNISGMEPMKGIQNVQEGFSSWSKTFPDLKAQIINTVVTEDWVVVEYVGRGTHQGPLEGPNGKVLQATGRKIEVPGCDLYRIENGKIVLAHIYWDSMVMLKQLGVLEGVKAAA